jgi:hypothetical protein
MAESSSLDNSFEDINSSVKISATFHFRFLSHFLRCSVIFVEQASVERVLFVFMSMWFSHACFELFWPRAQKGSLTNVKVSLSNIFKTHVVYGE